MQRREFLKVAGGVTAGLCLGCMSGCNSQAKTVIQGQMEINVNDFPELAVVGGWIRTKSTDYPPILIIHSEEGRYLALSAKCTHLGGPLQYQHPQKNIYCGWHHSEFDLEGQVIKGPAKRPLTQYRVEKQGDIIRIKNPA
jgi:cytochrome b6-f complex iron-sulfur subunit